MKTRQFVFVCIFARQCGLHSADSTIVPPAMIWWSGAKFGKCCSQTSELSQWPSRRQNMFINKFSRKDHTLTWKRTNVLLRRSVQPCPTTGHCCLAPCKSVTNYGPLTEPKFCIVKCALTQIPTSNGHISETKRAILDPYQYQYIYMSYPQMEMFKKLKTTSWCQSQGRGWWETKLERRAFRFNLMFYHKLIWDISMLFTTN